jgi:hypothetical protein
MIGNGLRLFRIAADLLLCGCPQSYFGVEMPITPIVIAKLIIFDR